MMLMAEASKSDSSSTDSMNYEAALTKAETKEIINYPNLKPDGWDAKNNKGNGFGGTDSHWMLL